MPRITIRASYFLFLMSGRLRDCGPFPQGFLKERRRRTRSPPRRGRRHRLPDDDFRHFSALFSGRTRTLSWRAPPQSRRVVFRRGHSRRCCALARGKAKISRTALGAAARWAPAITQCQRHAATNRRVLMVNFLFTRATLPFASSATGLRFSPFIATFSHSSVQECAGGTPLGVSSRSP